VARNLLALDDAIESVRVAPRGEKATEKHARLKILRDLVAEQDSMLASLKSHLLGRAETRSMSEPCDHYGGHAEIMFEQTVDEVLTRNWIERT